MNQKEKRALLPLCHHGVLPPCPHKNWGIIKRTEGSQFDGAALLLEKEVWLLKGSGGNQISEAIWLPRSTRQMVDGGLEGSRSGRLETPSAVHRGFHKNTLTGHKAKKCVFQFSEIIPLACILSTFFY